LKDFGVLKRICTKENSDLVKRILKKKKEKENDGECYVATPLFHLGNLFYP